MSRIIFINNEFFPAEKATISVMDRGFLFADGAYEVSAVLNGRLVDNNLHLARLQRSLNELNITMPQPLEKIIELQHKLIKLNSLDEGLVYIQVSRGASSERDFVYNPDTKPTFVMFTHAKKIIDNANLKNGVKIITVPDIRWARRDIKSTALLAQVLAKNEAHQKGAYEAWLVENHYITEGSSSNAFIIKNSTIITRNLSNEILHGITRATLLKLAKENKIRLEERPFTLAEALAADECFITSATNFVMGVMEIDGNTIGNGKVGETTLELLKLYIEEAQRSTHTP